ncbi:type 1 glutamine amidotransferase [Frondihabitans sp. VKM Ac-2883]|uniref:type 1 glutamine amidotransferase n=1 Tax=Frondihabitans sp. VKM Ac-2883 TaxID=2783823 RepID=UPI00188B46A6|nr:cobyric acid synthase [Frondihabitans sp. VKM Ac-2883]MBF4576449.1 cobyric acid synthase [Frondihabitans sp. VKM Ac-2883]
MTTLSLLQLYPEQLGVSGDGGNVVALAERARRAGLDVELVEHRPGDALPVGADLVVIGSGPLSTLRSIHSDALRFREALSDWADSGVPVVAIGGGMELLSQGIYGEGADLEGLGFFDASAHRGAKRRANYFRVETAYSGPSLTLFGFEDHATRFELAAGASAFGTVVSGGGNGDGTEGVSRGSSFGTQLKGPVLPLNPELTDRVLASAVSRIGGVYAAGPAHATLDEYARQSRLVIEKNLERAFKAM